MGEISNTQHFLFFFKTMELLAFLIKYFPPLPYHMDPHGDLMMRERHGLHVGDGGGGGQGHISCRAPNRGTQTLPKGSMSGPSQRSHPDRGINYLWTFWHSILLHQWNPDGIISHQDHHTTI